MVVMITPYRRLIESEAHACIGASTQRPHHARELAIQIHNEARKFAQGTMVKSVVTYGGTSVNYQAAQLTKGCNILVATPGRLMDYADKGKIAFSDLKYQVLDEADRMQDMGILAYKSLSPALHKKGSGKRTSITLETYAELLHLLGSDESLKI